MAVPKKSDGEADEETPLLDKSDAAVQEHSQEKTWAFIIVMFFLLIAAGASAVSFIEGWTVLTSLYVITQIVTTIGYGDFTVTSDTMKLFCAFYVLLVIVYGAYTMEKFFDHLQKKGAELTRERFHKIHTQMAQCSSLLSSLSPGRGQEELELQFEKFKPSKAVHDLIYATVLAAGAIGFGTVFYATYENCTCSYGVSRVEGCKLDTYDECVRTGGYVKSYIAAFYMSVISLTTVGFGDNSPRSILGRAVGIVWMLCGVASMANWFTKISHVFFEHAHHKRNLQVLSNHITDETFKKIDKDGDGILARHEFLEYYLLKNGLVSQEDLDMIDSYYEMLDLQHDGQVTCETVRKAEALAAKAAGVKKTAPRAAAR